MMGRMAGDLEEQPRHSGDNATIVPLGERPALPERPARPAPRHRARADSTQLLLALVVAASAFAAARAPGSPTGISGVDVAMKALLGAACALAGVAAPWLWITFAAAVTTAASLHEPTLFPSAVALGLAVAGVGFGGRRDRGEPARRRGWDSALVPATVSAVVCQVALRLDWPHRALLPSALAAAAMLALLVPGVVLAPARVRRRVLATCCILALAAIGLTALAGASVLEARTALTSALDSTHLGLHAAERGQQRLARTEFARAERQFGAAESDLSPARLAEVVPVVSQQVRAVRVASSVGHLLAAAAYATSAHANLGALRMIGGVFPIGALRALGPSFRRDLSTLDVALGQTAPFRSPWLVPPLRTKLTSEVAKLHQARHDAETGLLAVKEVPVILGADGMRRYLVLFENPAESRASGGVIGDYAVVDAVGGKLSLEQVASVAKLDSAGGVTRHLVGPADYIARYSQFQPQYTWENVPMSPDFPSVGEVAANLFPQSGGQPVNGVISIDPVAIAGLLAATGPVSEPQWPVTISSGNAVALLAHDEFIHFASDNAARLAFLQDLIRTVWHDLVTRHLPPLPTLAQDLLPALRGHHLLFYSTDPSVERFFLRVHLAGAMPPVHGDFIGVTTDNAVGNKLDWYLRRTIDYRAVLNRRTDQITATLTLTLHNLSPSSGLPPIILDPAPGAVAKPGEEELYLSVYSPWLSDGATWNGLPLVMTEQQELGRFVYSAFVKIPARSSATLVLHLFGTWPHRSEPYHLGMYQQPVLFPDVIHTSVKVVS
jgi:hypothetical protein